MTKKTETRIVQKRRNSLNGKEVKKPVRGRYKIEELICSSDPLALQEGEVDWGEPQGKEL